MRAIFIALLLLFPLSIEHHELTLEQKQKAEIQQLKETVFALKRDNAILQARLADLQARLDSSTLTEQDRELRTARIALEKELIAALGGKDTDTLDWTTSPPTLKLEQGDKR